MLKSALSMDSTFFSLRPGECAEAASVSHKRKTSSYIPVNYLINVKSFSLKHIASVFADKYNFFLFCYIFFRMFDLVTI